MGELINLQKRKKEEDMKLLDKIVEKENFTKEEKDSFDRHASKLYDITEGTVRKETASEVAINLMGISDAVFKKASSINFQDESEEYIEGVLSDLRKTIELLKMAVLSFEKYPEIKEVLEGYRTLFFYFEATIYSGVLTKKKYQDKLHKGVNTYFVRHPNTGLIKIGKASCVKDRIKALQTGAGVELEILAVLPENVELKLHKKFSKLRRLGEWFEDVDSEISLYAYKVSGQEVF